MSLQDLLIENSYRLLSITQEGLSVNLSKLKGHLSDEKKDKLNTLGIVDLAQWSDKEKNVFCLLLKNPHITDIVKVYNSESVKVEKVDRIKLFASLNTMNKFLKATAYNDSNFQKEVNEKVVSWNISGDTKKMTVLQDGFKNFVNMDKLKELLSTNIKVNDTAERYIENKKDLNEIKNSRSILSSVTAGSSAVLTMVMMSDQVAEVFNGIYKLAVDHYPTLKSSPNFANALIVVAMGITFYKLFEKINGLILKGAKAYQGHTIEGQNANSINDAYFKNTISKEFIGSIINNKKYESSVTNKHYLAMSSFICEKINNPALVVSPQFKANYGLSIAQVNQLNGLTKEKIHQLSEVSNPTARMMLLMNSVDNKQEAIILNLSNIESLNLENKKGKELIKNTIPDGVEPSLRNKINQMSSFNKQLVVYYLNLNMDKDKCKYNVCKELEDTLNQLGNGTTITDVLLSKSESLLKSQIESAQEKAKDRPLLHVKYIANMFANLKDIDFNNKEMKKDWEQICGSHQFIHTQKAMKNYSGIVDKTIEGKEVVMSKLQSLRNMFSTTPPSSTPPTI